MDESNLLLKSSSKNTPIHETIGTIECLGSKEICGGRSLKAFKSSKIKSKSNRYNNTKSYIALVENPTVDDCKKAYPGDSAKYDPAFENAVKKVISDGTHDLAWVYKQCVSYAAYCKEVYGGENSKMTKVARNWIWEGQIFRDWESKLKEHIASQTGQGDNHYVRIG